MIQAAPGFFVGALFALWLLFLQVLVSNPVYMIRLGAMDESCKGQRHVWALAEQTNQLCMRHSINAQCHKG